MEKSVLFFVLFSLTQCPSSSSAQNELSNVVRYVQPPAAFLAACVAYDWLCANEPRSKASPGNLLRKASSINVQVNATIEQSSDQELYGVEEKWILPLNGRGDCEDLALEKMRRLINAGVPQQSLTIAIAFGAGAENHAVLLLEIGGKFLVLDSLSDKLLESSRTGYRFLAHQDSLDRGRWRAAGG